MIQVRNNAALSAAVSIPATATIVPFDTTGLNTNSATALTGNKIQISEPGIYNTVCSVTVSNPGSSSVTAVLTAYANDNPITGATTAVSIGAAGSEEMILPWALKVVNAASGVATISWYLSGAAVNLNNAVAEAHRLV